MFLNNKSIDSNICKILIPYVSYNVGHFIEINKELQKQVHKHMHHIDNK